MTRVITCAGTTYLDNETGTRYSLWSTSVIHSRRTQDDQGLRAKTLTGIKWTVTLHRRFSAPCTRVDQDFTNKNDRSKNPCMCPAINFLLCCSKVSTKKLTRGSPWYWNCVVYLVQVEHYLTHLPLERFPFGSLVHEHTLHGDISFSTWTTCMINKSPVLSIPSYKACTTTTRNR